MKHNRTQIDKSKWIQLKCALVAPTAGSRAAVAIISRFTFSQFCLFAFNLWRYRKSIGCRKWHTFFCSCYCCCCCCYYFKTGVRELTGYNKLRTRKKNTTHKHTKNYKLALCRVSEYNGERAERRKKHFIWYVVQELCAKQSLLLTECYDPMICVDSNARCEVLGVFLFNKCFFKLIKTTRTRNYLWFSHDFRSHRARFEWTRA